MSIGEVPFLEAGGWFDDGVWSDYICSMTTRTELRKLEWPEVVPVSQPELDQLRANCEAIMAKGGEMGEIARDILEASNELTGMINRIDAFLGL